MKCLVTGASGFLGAHLCRKLEQLGHSVYKLHHDEMRRSYSYPGEVDYIFHLATYGNHAHQLEKRSKDHYPEWDCYGANIVGTEIILHETMKFKYKAFINVGSSSEYGRKGSCMREDMVLNPDTFYAATKAAGTHLARAFAKQYDKPIITVRPFSIYGPGEASHRFIPTVIHKILANEQLDLVEGEHDWIHVSDVVDGMIKLLPHVDKYKGEVFNIGTGEAYTNGFVVQTIEKLLGMKAIVKNIEGIRPFDSGVWCADTTKLKSVLGYDFKPRHIITGLKEIVDSYGT